MAKNKKKHDSSALQLKEKLGLLFGDGFFHCRGVERLNIEGIDLHDGPCGLRNVPNTAVDTAAPTLATCFPAPCLLASSWDESLLSEVGSALGKECRLQGTHVLLAPGMNIKRSPLCGRNFEYYSEDPLLSGKMGAAMVKGIQKENVGACIKHYACNSQETERMVCDSIIDQRALHELYLKPFEIAVKESDPWMIMTSYNLINGVYASENSYLVKDLLKGEWKYPGVVVSDWGAVNDPVLSHENGLDIEMPSMYNRTRDFTKAVRQGKMSRVGINESVSRILNLYDRCHATIENPEPYRLSDGHAIAVNAAERSAVLLKNEKALPLKDFAGVCVIGAFASEPRFQGGGSAKVNPNRLVSFIEAAKSAGLSLPYCEGFSLTEISSEANNDLFVQACDLAAKSKTVLLFLGLPEEEESEGMDRETTHLGEKQITLFNTLYEVNPNIIVILSCGAPVDLPFKDKAKAILLMYLGGEGVGEATLHLLSGEACPSGKLAESWPIRLSDTPCFGFYPGSARQALYRESIYVGYRYYLTAGKAVNYPFGYGLSYADFSYGSLTLSKATLAEEGEVVASVSVTNRSSFQAETVVELYAEAEFEPKSFRPKRILIGFTKLKIPAKSSRKASFSLKKETFAVYDPDTSSFKTEAGTYRLGIGTSCEDIVSSASLQVNSSDEFVSKRGRMATYYELNHSGFLAFDNDFENLLGSPLTNRRDSRSRPYNLNSTFGDISDTWIGKKVFSAATSYQSASFSKEAMEHMLRETPLRNVSVIGLSPRFAYALRDFANGHPLRALVDIIFNRRKGK